MWIGVDIEAEPCRKYLQRHDIGVGCDALMHIHATVAEMEASQRALPSLGQLDRDEALAMMAALDCCNGRPGRGTVVEAAAWLPPARAA